MELGASRLDLLVRNPKNVKAPLDVNEIGREINASLLRCVRPLSACDRQVYSHLLRLAKQFSDVSETDLPVLTDFILRHERLALFLDVLRESLREEIGRAHV